MTHESAVKDVAGRPLAKPVLLLKIAAFGLFVLFGCNLLASVLPPRLIDPAWQMALFSGLQSLSFLPLIGICLLLVGPDLQIGSSRHRLGWIRKASAVACIGYLWLIPLQASAMWRLGILAEVPANRTIASIAASRAEIGSSRTLGELNTALAKLPGAPKLPPGFNQPLDPIRQSMQQKLGSDLEKLRADQQQRISGRRIPELLVFTKSVIIDLVFAVFFGAVAGFKAPRLPAKLALANPFPLIAKSNEKAERQGSARRRAAQISGQPGPIGRVIKTVDQQIKDMKRRRDAKRLAAKVAASRRSRRG
ncbi:MAG: hypothetical protein WCQ20_09670 [Synechococcaceae cyanobacterium ELA739]|jgi:hypothetical protein